MNVTVDRFLLFCLREAASMWLSQNLEDVNAQNVRAALFLTNELMETPKPAEDRFLLFCLREAEIPEPGEEPMSPPTKET